MIIFMGVVILQQFVWMFNIEKYKELSDFISKNGGITEIIAISKNHPKESIIEAINGGVKIFGENRVFEAKSKFKDLKKLYPEIELHLTGPLQSNKVKEAIQLFDVFHTLDREKIAREFSKHKEALKNKKIFIQVNTGREKSKSGIYPEHLGDFKLFCTNDMKLNIVGLMCIPPINDDPKIHFEILKDLGGKNKITKLSIGMSNDYYEALYFNPEYIRLGTVLFGSREWNKK